MPQYAILTQEGGSEAPEYPLADRTIKTCRDLAKLRVRSAHLSQQDRYDIATRWGFRDWIAEEEEIDTDEGRQVQATMKMPDLDRYEFAIEAAKVLFPTAPVEGNEEYIDAEALIEARDDFLSRTGVTKNPLGGLLSSLTGFQADQEAR